MYLIQILLPLYDNDSRRIPRTRFEQTAFELSERFGGLTAYTRAPAAGLWKKSRKQVDRDDIVIYEVMSPRMQRVWWRTYRRTLEKRFRQKEVIIRAQKTSML
jgi:hypothetical protein